MIVMEYFAPEEYSTWKRHLRAGDVDIRTAHATGARLAFAHRVTADDAGMQARFDAGRVLEGTRIDPYFRSLLGSHPDLTTPIETVIHTALHVKRAVAHGDASPKNILVGRDGPVFIDGECACYGDPAFDLAFCSSHLLLKSLVQPGVAHALREAFTAFARAYVSAVTWESPSELEHRAALYLPALLLARVDGKSTVEYIEAECDRARVRQLARAMLRARPQRVAETLDASRR